ncbi:hypothetical protein A8H39_01890 [Paraburkholderia fungorum]|nr:hypothetical protein A8H39_01890 [Paraburkholderia fungorum]
MSTHRTRARQDLIQYLRRQPVVAGLTFLVLTAVNIPVTIATVRIWRLLLAKWNSTSWNVLEEFFVDALIATLISLLIWLVVGVITWTWLAERRSSGGPEQ